MTIAILIIIILAVSNWRHRRRVRELEFMLFIRPPQQQQEELAPVVPLHVPRDWSE